MINRTWTSLAVLACLICSSCAEYAAPVPVADHVSLPLTDLPKYSKSIEFCGRIWDVKNSVGAVGPGPNYFSDGPENVFVDEKGNLHLKITRQNIAGKTVWTSSEVITRETFGYGEYVFFVESPLDSIDKNIVVGLFTWSMNPQFFNREIDIEIARWGADRVPQAQFVVSPFYRQGHLHQFDLGDIALQKATYKFNWSPGSVQFQAYSGHFFQAEDQSKVIAWNYQANDVPPTYDENIRLNFWLIEGMAPSDQRESEVVFNCFHWRP